jgi:S-adenosylmethionine decarboxylase proenzyme
MEGGITMQKLGRHLIIEYSDCDRDVLSNAELLEQYLNEAVRKSGATAIRSVFHRYHPQGISGVVVIAESHFSIHTWPEYGYAAVDFFTCGQTVNPHKAHEYMLEALRCESSDVTELNRGIPSDTDIVLRHKDDTPFVGIAAAGP